MLKRLLNQRYSIWSTKMIIHMPKPGEHFRVGRWTGVCVYVNSWFIIGRRHRTAGWYKI